MRASVSRSRWRGLRPEPHGHRQRSRFAGDARATLGLARRTQAAVRGRCLDRWHGARLDSRSLDGSKQAALGRVALVAAPPCRADSPRSLPRSSRSTLPGELSQRRQARSRADPRGRRHPPAGSSRLGDEAAPRKHGRAGRHIRLNERAAMAAPADQPDGVASAGGPEHTRRRIAASSITRRWRHPLCPTA